MPRRALVLAGPCGAGKTTLGTALAARTGLPFVDADDHHSPAAVAALARCEPLDDAYRRDWLAAVAASAAAAASDVGVIIACSALGAHHRTALRANLAAAGVADVSFAVLVPPDSVLRARLEGRAAQGGAHHLVRGTALLPSQLATLQPPTASEADAAVFNGASVSAADVAAWWGGMEKAAQGDST